MISGGAVVVLVKDVGQAARFYIETLGMKLVSETERGTSIIDAGDGFRLELTAGPSPSPSPVHLYTKVPLEEAVAIFDNRGVAITIETQGKGAPCARFCDPDGNRFVLFPQPADASDA